MAKLYLDICLSDIPKELITTARNGKKYFKCMVSPRKSVDKDGYDHYIAAYIPKDRRNPEDAPLFVGRAQDKEQKGYGHHGELKDGYQEPDNTPLDKNEDLPF